MEMYEQCNLFNEELPLYQIKKPIRLIELFSGIGAQFKALKQITDKISHYKICEWCCTSVKSYNAIHVKDNKDYSTGLTKEQLIDKVLGISVDTKKALTYEQLQRKPIKWLREVYNNNVATHNLLDITKVHAKDLEIVDTDKYEYILTYSYPCQAISNAGKMQGQQKGSGTTSSLIWEVDRIMNELERERERERESLPQILVMENVEGATTNAAFKKDFEIFEKHLTDLGYSNHIMFLNAKDYGIPQNRERVIMISILGKYGYDKPIKLDLETTIEDFLEEKASDKYYLTKNMINTFTKEKNGNFSRKERWLYNLNRSSRLVANALTTRSGERPTDNFVFYEVNNKAVIDTLKQAKEIGNNYILDCQNSKTCKNIMPTITTRVSASNKTFIVKEIKVATEINNRALIECDNKYYAIRKLTPKECYMLMGFQESDYDLVKDLDICDCALFQQTGDSIVVPMLIAVFAPLFSNPSKHREIITDYVRRIRNE